MSKGTRRYGRSKKSGKRRHRKGGSVLSRALVPAALYLSQKRMQRRKSRRTKKNRSRKRRGGYHMKGGMSPLSPGSYGSQGSGKGNLVNVNFNKNLGASVGSGLASADVGINLKGKLGSNLVR